MSSAEILDMQMKRASARTKMFAETFWDNFMKGNRSKEK